MEKTADKKQLSDYAKALADTIQSWGHGDRQTGEVLDRFLALLEKAEKANNQDQIMVLGQALQPMAPKLTDHQKERALRLLLVAFNNDDADFPNPVCDSAASLANESTLPMIIYIMKWPTCTSSQRDALIAAVAQVTNDTGEFERRDGNGEERPSLWQFAAWAQRQPYVDLANPPAE